MTPTQQDLLLDLARAAIAEAFGGPAVEQPPGEPWLDEPAALFVSLHRHGELRGCIGSLEARHSLFEEVVEKARAAAFHDRRMIPVQAHELPDMDIEVTLLHPLEPLRAGSEDEVAGQLRPGLDGLVLRSREGGAVFIPSVWRQIPEPRDFLRALIRKAQLQRWPADMSAFRFTVDELSSAGSRV